MTQVGLIGWRGMVGSVLTQRMLAEDDFEHIDPVFFSTSQAGGAGPDVGRDSGAVRDARDLTALAECEVLISWTERPAVADCSSPTTSTR